MPTQHRRANACSPQPLLRKREPRTQLRCFETKPGIFNMSSDATGKIFLSDASGLMIYGAITVLNYQHFKGCSTTYFSHIMQNISSQCDEQSQQIQQGILFGDEF